MKVSTMLITLLVPLQAATHYVDHSVGTSGDGSSWPTAFITIQEALAASSAADVILVAAGNYYPDEGGSFSDNDRTATFQLVEGVRLEGGYPNGGGARDLASHRTVLSGDIDQNDDEVPSGSNCYTVVSGTDLTSSTLVDGFLITAGLADGPTTDQFDGPTRAGGGIYNDNSDLAIQNCTFAGNSAGFGGGVFGTGSSPTLINCIFSGNSAGFFGGGINNRNNSSPSLTNCTFTGNSAGSGSGGGAITNFALSNPELTNCILWNNQANGSSAMPASSVNDGGSTMTTYNYSLVQNINPGGTNLDGTNPDSSPNFLIPTDPNEAPTLLGDQRLAIGSPALDVGSNSANNLPVDSSGADRVQNTTIDLGALEGAFAPVTPEVFYVDQSNGSRGDGTSWASAFVNLQDALAVTVGGQTILVAAGTYYPDEGGSMSDDDRGASFNLQSTITIVGGHPEGGGIRDLTNHPTILSGDIDQDDEGVPNNTNSFSVLTAHSVDSTAILDGFIIIAGFAEDTTSEAFQAENSGGGLHMHQGSPTLLNCWLKGNSARFGGAAFAISNSRPSFVNCAFSGNFAELFGGALNARVGSRCFWTNCTLTGNSAGNGGGALYSFSNSDHSLTNSIVWNNSADGSTTSPSASLLENSSTAIFEHSLVANLDPSGTNLDGTSGLANPFFAISIDPAEAPSLFGDLRLTSGTLCLNFGDTSAITSQDIDLGGNPRFVDSIVDLGAFEGEVVISDADGDGLPDYFELVHTSPPSTTSLSPNSNLDGDSFKAFEEFVLGLDPNVPNSEASVFDFETVGVGGSDYLSISVEILPIAGSFVEVSFERSFDLSTNSWSSADLVPLSLSPSRIGVRSNLVLGSQQREFLRLKILRE